MVDGVGAWFENELMAGYNFLTGGVVLDGKQDGRALVADRPLNTNVANFHLRSP